VPLEQELQTVLPRTALYLPCCDSDDDDDNDDDDDDDDDSDVR